MAELKTPYRPKPKGSNSNAHLQRLLNNCGHCGRLMNNFDGGYSRGPHGEYLCLPNGKDRPNCYKLVVLYKHPLPCDGATCYEAHPDLITYIDLYIKEKK